MLALVHNVNALRAPARVRARHVEHVERHARTERNADADKNSRRGFFVVPRYLELGQRLLNERRRRGNREMREEVASDSPHQNKGGVGPATGQVGNAQSRIAGPGKTVGKVVQIGIQRAKEFFKTKAGKFTRTGARATLDDLVKAIQAGEDVVADSPSLARELARTAGGGKTPILHEVPRGPLEQGFLPHYHPHGLKAHVFFEPKGGFGIKDLLDLVGPVLIGPFENYTLDGIPRISGSVP